MFCCYCYFRIDELEKQLLEDMQGGETDSSDGEDKESGNGDEDLSEEHRSFHLQSKLNTALQFSSFFPLISFFFHQLSLICLM